jgi:iron(III) transport system permease protein
MLIGGKYRVLAVELYNQLTGWADTGVCAVLGIALLVPAAALFLVQRFMLEEKIDRTGTVGGRGVSAARPTLPFSMRVALAAVTLLLALLILSQAAAVIAGAFSKLWGIDNSFTLDNIIAAVNYKKELTKTVLFSLAAAAITTTIALFLAFASSRTNLPLRGFAGFITLLGAAVPGTFLGLAYVIAFNGTPLSGGPFIIIIVMTVYELPASYRILLASLKSLKHSIDDSAQSLGADKLYIFRTLIVPLAKTGIVSSFVLVFVRAAGTLSAVVFLMSFSTKLSSALILNLAAEAQWGRAAALALILNVVVFAVIGIVRGVGGISSRES